MRRDLRRRHARARHQRALLDARQTRRADHREDRGDVVGLIDAQPLEAAAALVRSNAGPRRRRVEHDAAANRHRRRIGADDESIVTRQHGGRFEPQPHQRARARRNLVSRLVRRSLGGGGRSRDRDAAEHFRRAVVHAHARAVLERLRRRQQIDRRIDAARDAQRARRGQRFSARDVADVDAAKIDRGALAGDRRGGRAAVHLDAAHLDLAALRQHRQLVVRSDAARTPACRSRPCRSLSSRTRDRSAGASTPSTGRLVTRAACAAMAARKRVESVARRRRHLDHVGVSRGTIP